MPKLSLTGVLVVAPVAFVVPPVLGLFPSVVLEIAAGLVIGRVVLGPAGVDLAPEVLAPIGLAFVPFLAGLEIGPGRPRGGRFSNAGPVQAPLFVASPAPLPVFVVRGLPAAFALDGRRKPGMARHPLQAAVRLS